MTPTEPFRVYVDQHTLPVLVPRPPVQAAPTERGLGRTGTAVAAAVVLMLLCSVSPLAVPLVLVGSLVMLARGDDDRLWPLSGIAGGLLGAVLWAVWQWLALGRS